MFLREVYTKYKKIAILCKDITATNVSDSFIAEKAYCNNVDLVVDEDDFVTLKR